MKTYTLMMLVAITLLMFGPLSITSRPSNVGTPPEVTIESPEAPVSFTASPYSDEFVLTGTESVGGEFYHPSNKDGTFGAKTAIPGDLGNVDGLAIADFDGDGDLDFVLGQGEAGKIYLYTNDGSGAFTPSEIASGVTPSSFCSQFRVEDFNRDGRLDFVGGDFYGPKWWFRNDGGGTFTMMPLDTSWHTIGALFALDAGDFNNDGNADIIMVSMYGGNKTGKVRLYLGDGSGGFTHSQVIDLYADLGVGEPVGLAAGDFDNDANLDIVIGGDGTSTPPPDPGAFWLYRGNGLGGFSLVGKVFNVKGAAELGQVGVDAFDIDHDGNMDVVAYNWDGGQFFFIRGNGDGTFQTPVVIDATLGYGVGIAAPFSPTYRPLVGGEILPFNTAPWIAITIAGLIALFTVAITLRGFKQKLNQP